MFVFSANYAISNKGECIENEEKTDASTFF